MDRWLFLDSGPAPGAENMAVDELLLARAERGGLPSVLRLYSFDPPAITIGVHQTPERVLDLDAVRADGIDVVRRITGGRALLHDGEITYCVVVPAGTARFAQGPGETFMKISDALCAALRRLGVDAAVSRGRDCARARGPAPPCLSSVTRHELSVGGRKIAGSAQRRTAGAFLQHGSILLRPGSERIAKYVRGSWAPLEDGITFLSRERGGGTDASELRTAVREAFEEKFAAAFETFPLSEADGSEVRDRARAKRRETVRFSMEEVGSP